MAPAGDIQYGGGFMHLYLALGLATGGSLPAFQVSRTIGPLRGRGADPV
jgi:hypothetical protein